MPAVCAQTSSVEAAGIEPAKCAHETGSRTRQEILLPRGTVFEFYCENGYEMDREGAIHSSRGRVVA
jgi:hypothetical protein